MYKKKLLLLSLITISSINFCDYPESTEKKIPQEDEIQAEALLSNLPPEQMIKLLSVLSHIEKLRLLVQAQENALSLEKELNEKKEAQRLAQAAHQKEADKGFSFTECGIVLRDTFFDEFNLRRFSLEFCENLVKTLKKIVLQKVINETFNGVDFAFGTLPARHIHPNAGIYPIQFLTSGSLSEYFDQRTQLAQRQDPRVRALHQEADQLIEQHNINQALLDAQKRVRTVKKVVEDEDPKVRALYQQADHLLEQHNVNPALLGAQKKLDIVKNLIEQKKLDVQDAQRALDDYKDHHRRQIAIEIIKKELREMQDLVGGLDENTLRGIMAQQFIDFLRKDLRVALSGHTMFYQPPSADRATTAHQAPSTDPATSTHQVPSAQPATGTDPD